MKSKAKPATRPKEKKAKEAAQQKRAAKPISKAAKPATKAAKPATKAAKPTAKAAKPTAKAAKKPTAKAAKPATKAAKKPTAKAAKPATKAEPIAKVAKPKIPKLKAKIAKPKAEVVEVAASPAYSTTNQFGSLLMIPDAKFVKVPFFFDIEEEAGKRKYIVQQKLPEKPTACSRPKINGNLDSKNLVEFLSQQLEYENKTYFEGCEGQICVKCNINNVDAKFYVDKSLGYCTECAVLLGLGQSKEGVFSDVQMELMRHSMEKLENVKDIDDESDIESALGDMDTLELEETLLSEEDADFV